jgi:type I restriction enzyme M protein
VPIEELIERGYDLSAKNPNKEEAAEIRPARDLVQSIKDKEERILDLLGELESTLEED